MTHVLDTDVDRHREPEHEILPVLYERWSPRAMNGEAIDDEQLMRLFEAARWAPSSYNGQPWRFVYAKRDSPDWNAFLGLLTDFNRQWADDASVLVVLLSRTRFEHNGEPARTHSLDAGAAWQNLALQGRAMDLVVHGMQGFDYAAAAELLEIDDDLQVEMMIAIGRPAPRESLEEELEKREKPSSRKPLEELAFEGRLPS